MQSDRSVSKRKRAFLALCLLAALTPLSAAEPLARADPDADRLFHSDPRWLGGDDASSIELSRGRLLWLFGDSFVAQSPPYHRANASFIRNSIAIQIGNDLRSAKLHFLWRNDGSHAAAPFFADAERHWYWPAGGIRLTRGPLLIFLRKIVATPGHGLGFEVTGHALVRIDNPDAPPLQWRLRIVDQQPAAFDVLPGAAVIINGTHAVVLATRQHGTPGAALVRYRLKAFARGDLSKAEWWTGNPRGWQPSARVGGGGPLFVIDDAGAECSVHWDADAKRYVHVASYGFGAATIGIRTAGTMTGPWSAPRMVYKPPESDAVRPFVYAGKAHPDVRVSGSRGLVISYVANSFEPNVLLSRDGDALYWPRFAVVPGERPETRSAE